MVIEAPEPAEVPPQLPVYHFQEASVPREPPDTVKLVALPGQTGLGLANAPVGATDKVLTDTTTVAQLVVLHKPSALT